MKIALFSDVHGHLRILLHLIRNWQMAHKTRLDGALIAGDLGCFPDPAKFDKATRRWIQTDPEEAGFSKYFTRPDDSVKRLFGPEFGQFSGVYCPIFFVPGNHEDYDFLQARQLAAGGKDTFTVDCYALFRCIRDGAVVTLRGRDRNRLRVAGIWGIENTLPQAPYRIKPATVQELVSKGKNSFDFLLTHDAPAGGHPVGGSQAVTSVIRACEPNVHLFGHVHPVGRRHEYNVPDVGTKSVLMNNVSFGKKRDKDLAGAMGILDWDGANACVEPVQEGWIKRMRDTTWEQVLPEE